MIHDDRATAQPRWRVDSGDAVLVLEGDWIAQAGKVPVFEASTLEGFPSGQKLVCSISRLGVWDSGLVGFLWDAKRNANAHGLVFDPSGLPETAQKLLSLLPDRMAQTKQAPRRRFAPLNEIGGRTIGFFTTTGIAGEMLGSVVRSIALSLLGRIYVRRRDLLANLRDAGPSALLIVSVVNFLLGAILAFVGAVQLRKFAAGAYVANLVGIAMVREMSAVMTAIVMSGRTGGAYAARISTMQGNEELDALQVIGISTFDYIVLPSVLALLITMPLLYLYGCVMGILGGLVVATAMLDVTATGFIHQTLGAIPLSQFVFGFVKSAVFALLIGLSSCQIGMRAGRSAADVGIAATSAVVIGIVGVIALDAVFAVFADMVGI